MVSRGRNERWPTAAVATRAILLAGVATRVARRVAILTMQPPLASGASINNSDRFMSTHPPTHHPSSSSSSSSSSSYPTPQHPLLLGRPRRPNEARFRFRKKKQTNKTNRNQKKKRSEKSRSTSKKEEEEDRECDGRRFSRGPNGEAPLVGADVIRRTVCQSVTATPTAGPVVREKRSTRAKRKRSPNFEKKKINKKEKKTTKKQQKLGRPSLVAEAMHFNAIGFDVTKLCRSWRRRLCRPIRKDDPPFDSPSRTGRGGGKDVACDWLAHNPTK